MCHSFRWAGVLLAAIAIVALAGRAMPQSRPAPAGYHVFVGDHFALKSQPDEQAAAAGVALSTGETVQPTLSQKDSKGLLWLGWQEKGKAVWAPEPLIAYVPEKNIVTGNIPIGEEQVDRWRAVPPTYEPTDLVALPAAITYDIAHRTCRMRAEAAQKAEEMFAAAHKDGIELRVVSGFRSADVQRGLFLRRISLSGYGQETVAKPGHSEHQLGTAMDVNGLDAKTACEQSFGLTREGQWLKTNCTKFGFVISYTEQNKSQTGYAVEPWHVRYVGVEKAKDWKPLGPPDSDQ